MKTREEIELLFSIQSSGQGDKDILDQIEQIERAAKTASAAIQAVATQPGLITSKGQFTNMFSGTNVNPGANVKFGPAGTGSYNYMLQGMSGGGRPSGSGRVEFTKSEVLQAFDEEMGRKADELDAAFSQAKISSEELYAALEKLDELSRKVHGQGWGERYTQLQMELKEKEKGAEQDKVDLENKSKTVDMTEEQIAATKRQIAEQGNYRDQYKNSTKEIEDINNQSILSAEERAEKNKKIAQAEYALAIKHVNEMRKLQFAGRALTEISQTFFVPSMAVLTGSLAMAQNYVKNATMATETTIQWKNSTESLKHSQAEVGKVVADIGLPILEKVASLVKTVAGYAESHPEVVKGVLEFTTGMALLSGVGLLLAKGIRLYADVKFMVATGALITAENNLERATLIQAAATAENTKALGLESAVNLNPNAGAKVGILALIKSTLLSVLGSALGPILLLIAGTVVGNLAYNKVIKPALKIEGSDAFTSEKQMFTATLAGFGGAISGLIWAFRKGTPVADEVASATMRITKALGALLGVVNKPIVEKPLDFAAIAEDYLPMWEDYQKQVADADAVYAKQRVQIEKEYEKQRTEVVKDYAQQQAEATDQYGKDIASAWGEYNKSESESIRTYYRTRIKEASDNSQKLLEMEQDHQKEMLRDLEDHEDRQKSLLETRDGLAMLREDEQYEKERKRKEEDYAIEVARTSQDFAKTMRENAARFNEERAQRQAAFRQQMADAAANYKATQLRLKAEEAQKLKDMDAAHAEQLASLKSSYDDQLAALDKSFRDSLRKIFGNIFGDQKAIQEASAKAYAAFLGWLQQAQVNYKASVSGGTVKKPGAATGGYVGFGQYTLGEEGMEFVLNNRSTRLAESAVGGRLTQQSIMSALIGGKSGGYSDHRNIQFNGVTEADRAAIRRDIYDITKQVFMEGMA
jgi:hypothetical protein